MVCPWHSSVRVLVTVATKNVASWSIEHCAHSLVDRTMAGSDVVNGYFRATYVLQ